MRFCRYLLMFSLGLCNDFFNLLSIDFRSLKMKRLGLQDVGVIRFATCV